MSDLRNNRAFGHILRAVGMGASIGALVGLLVYLIIAVSPYSTQSSRAVAEAILFPLLVVVAVVAGAFAFRWIAPRLKTFGSLAVGLLVCVIVAVFLVPRYIYLPAPGIGIRLVSFLAVCGAVVAVAVLRGHESCSLY